MPRTRILAQADIEDIASAGASIVKAGGTIIYPTDTVYGIGADATNPGAVAKVRAIKGMSEGKPMSVMVSDFSMIEELCETGIWEDIILKRHLPGPFTFILRAKETLACAGEGTIGIRMPKDEFCMRLAALSGRPIITTSANLSGDPAPSDFREINDMIIQKVDLSIDGGQIRSDGASTVVDLVRRKLIRKGSGEIDLLQFPV